MHFLRQLSAVFGVHVRDAMMRPVNALVAAGGAAGVAFILVSVLAVADGLTKAAEQAGSASIGLIVAQDAPMEGVSSIPEEQLSAALSLLGDRPEWRDSASVEFVRPMDTISRGGEAGSQVIGRGISATGLRMRSKFHIVAGRMFQPGKYEVIVGRRLARDVAGLAIGGTVTGSARDWEIVGMFENGGSLDESEVWSDLEAARTENGGRADVSSLRIPLSADAGLAELRAALATNPQVQLIVVSERAYQTEMSSALVRRVKTLAFALAVLLGVGAIVAMINTTYSAIAARERCVATLRAIGFDGAPVATAVFVESLLLGFAGGVVGGVLALALANGWGLSLLNTATHTPIALDAAVTWSSFAFGVLGGVALGALAAVLPSIHVARADVLAQ
jgi:putative ABC transport system permease protein